MNPSPNPVSLWRKNYPGVGKLSAKWVPSPQAPQAQQSTVHLASRPSSLAHGFRPNHPNKCLFCRKPQPFLRTDDASMFTCQVDFLASVWIKAKTSQHGRWRGARGGPIWGTIVEATELGWAMTWNLGNLWGWKVTPTNLGKSNKPAFTSSLSSHADGFSLIG